MTVGEHLALAAAWDARRHRMIPFLVAALGFGLLGLAVWWPFLFGLGLGAPYWYAGFRARREVREVNDIFAA